MSRQEAVSAVAATAEHSQNCSCVTEGAALTGAAAAGAVPAALVADVAVLMPVPVETPPLELADAPAVMLVDALVLVPVDAPVLVPVDAPVLMLVDDAPVLGEVVELDVTAVAGAMLLAVDALLVAGNV